MEATNKDWAKAIAKRLSDESDIKENFPEDAELLENILSKLFYSNPWAVNQLMGTSIIEENYFAELT